MTISPTEIPTPPPVEVPPIKALERPRPLTSLIASAQRLTEERVRRSGLGSVQQGWQADAWDMFDLVGEQHYLATTLAGRMGQARLYVGEMTDDVTEVPEPTTNSAVKAVLESIGTNIAGRAQLVTRLATNMFVAGEGWLVGIPNHLLPGYDGPFVPNDTPLDDIALEDLEWRMLSVSEVATVAGGNVELRYGSGRDDTIETSADNLYLIRVWRPHPRRHWEADSPTRSCLPVLRELVGLTMHVSAQIDSRLAGAGLLIVPQSAQRAMQRAMGLPEDSEEDPFTEALIEAMVTPIQDRSSASAVVPLVAVVPDEAVGAFQHIKFSTEFDSAAGSQRDESIRRLALSQDAPPELLLGTAGMNHWGAWLVQEEVAKTHLEPPLALICDAITTQYLWPVLESMGFSQADRERYVVWYDIEHLVVRPNRSGDAKDLHERHVISDEALRAALGFDEHDAPDEPAPAVALAIELVRANPALLAEPGLAAVHEQVQALLAGTPIPAPAIDGSGTGTDETMPDEGTPPEQVGEPAPTEEAVPVG